MEGEGARRPEEGAAGDVGWVNLMVVYEPSDAIVNEYPHPVFERIYRNAYRLPHGWGGYKGNSLYVKAYLVKIETGEANFDDAGYGIYCQNITIGDEYLRNGLANAMYVLAEIVYRKTLFDFWGGDKKQSTLAKLLWAQKDRPFGKEEFIGARWKVSDNH